MEARRLAEADGDGEAAAVAERARGLVLVERGAGAGAARVLRGAVELAERAGRFERAAQARGSLAWVLALCGRGPEALAELELARPHLHGLDRARLEMQVGMVLHKLDQPVDALEHYRRALVGFRRHGDTLWEARVLCNRGILHAERGAFANARADLARSERLERLDGRVLGAAHMVQNLGWLAATEGDAPSAFAAFDRAEREIRDAGGTLAVLWLDRIALLSSVALHDEARAAAERSVGELRRSGMQAYRAEARLALAGIATHQGDTATAVIAARRARAAFVAQDRPRWALLAELAEVRAGGRRTRTALARAERVADALADAGWRTLAVEARVLHAQLALELGETAVARAGLARASRCRDRSGPAGRIAAWHAEALLREHEGRPAAAASAVRAGLRVLEAHRALLGATELRARAGVHGTALARLGVRLAVARRDATGVLVASERHRAQALHFPPVRPPVDPVLARLLGELRQAAARLDEAMLEGSDTRTAASTLSRLERAVVAHARHAAPLAARADMTHGEAAHGEAAHGEAAHGEAAHGEAARGEASLGAPANGRATPGESARSKSAAHGEAAHGVSRRDEAAAGAAEPLPPRGEAARHEPAGEGALGTMVREGLVDAGWALVELVECDRALYAVAVARGRARLVRLGTLAEAEREAQTLRFALRRLVTGHGSEQMRAPVQSLADTAAAALDRLFAPAIRAAGDAPLVVVPTQSLHALPWAALPSLAQRPVSVAPSAALWLRAARAPRLGGNVLAVAGPELEHAQGEVRSVAEAVGGARVLVGADATAAATLEALNGCGHAHVAAHGSFRADNPLFSSLKLADGPLTVFDLETLQRPPERIALFACDAGLSSVQPGDELMGLTAALIGLGTRTVIASVLPLPDAASARIAPQLAASASPAEALAALHEPGAVGLVCYGAG